MPSGLWVNLVCLKSLKKSGGGGAVSDVRQQGAVLGVHTMATLLMHCQPGDGRGDAIHVKAKDAVCPL